MEDRRTALEKYMQLLSQDPRVSNSVTFNGLLLAAQRETSEDRHGIASALPQARKKRPT